MSAQPLESPPPRSVVDQLVAHLEELVVGSPGPGSQLPSEGDLAQQHGVSRLTVREALKVLAGRGLVELSRGRRPVVREPDSSLISGHFAMAVRRDPRALLELAQVRQALEVQAASLAAQRRSRASLAAVEGALAGMVEASQRWPDGVEAYHRADVAFHEALALASGNRMLAFILEGLEESLLRSFDRSFEGHVVRGGRVEAVLAAHRAILDRVREGDAAGAASAMRSHLRDAERDLRAALVDPTGVGPEGQEAP